jgi:hypothetical protein
MDRGSVQIQFLHIQGNKREKPEKTPNVQAGLETVIPVFERSKAVLNNG